MSGRGGHVITPVVLSHRTAWLFHHAPDRDAIQRQMRDYRSWDEGLYEKDIADRIRRLLIDCGVPSSELDIFELLSSRCYERGNTSDFRFHVMDGRSWEGLLTRASADIYVVDEPLCLVQAATWMSPNELLEYAFELCADYESQFSDEGWGYVGLPARYTPEELLEKMAELAGVRGVYKARTALGQVKAGARSPMETALAMMVTAPRSRGGLGYPGIVLNDRVDVPSGLRRHYSSSYFELDICAPRHGVGLEYDGGDHAELGRRTHDVDRASALAAMGYEVRNVTSRHFSRQLELHRVLAWFADRLSLNIDMDAEFQRKQNELREFVIRRWRT